MPSIECFSYSTKTGLFTDVGTEGDVLAKYGRENVKWIEGNIVILPGLHDAHGHIMHVDIIHYYRVSNGSMAKC